MLNGVSDFFNQTTLNERMIYSKRSPLDTIRWELNSSTGENREYLKVVAHPQYHFPSNPHGFRYIMIREKIFLHLPFYVLRYFHLFNWKPLLPKILFPITILKI